MIDENQGARSRRLASASPAASNWLRSYNCPRFFSASRAENPLLKNVRHEANFCVEIFNRRFVPPHQATAARKLDPGPDNHQRQVTGNCGSRPSPQLAWREPSPCRPAAWSAVIMTLGLRCAPNPNLPFPQFQRCRIGMPASQRTRGEDKDVFMKVVSR